MGPEQGFSRTLSQPGRVRLGMTECPALGPMPKKEAPLQKPAVLLINLGSPKSPDIADVKDYVKELLADPHLSGLSWPLQQLLVDWFIAPKLIREQADLHQKTWTSEGSPLLINSYRFMERFKPLVADREVELATRYGHPSIRRALENLMARGVEDLDVLPLYPHYAAASVSTVLSQVRKLVRELGFSGKVRYVKEFFDQPAYITPLANSIVEVLQRDEPDHLLFSFQGFPEHQISANGQGCRFDQNCCANFRDHSPSCYRAQCLETAKIVHKAVEKSINIPFSVAFQSRTTSRRWLKPFTHFHAAAAKRISLFDVGSRREVARGALQVVSHGPVKLVTECLLDQVGDHRGDPAELCVAKGVTGSLFGEETAVRVASPLGNHHRAIAVFVDFRLHRGDETIVVEIHLG